MLERIRKYLRGMRIFLLPVLCLVLSGCGEKETRLPDPAKGDYAIYYLNSTGMALENVIYSTEETDTEKLAEEIFREMGEKPGNSDYQTALPAETKLAYLFLENNVLTLNFDKSYYNMTREREIMCRAALARTLTQIPGVDYISISCDGQPLQNDAGNPVGAFAGSDFVYSIANVNDFERVELTLYFADESGTSLVPEEREVVHNMSTSLEKLVVDQLLAGPQAGGTAVIPKDTRVLGVSNTDGICYVNLDSTFAAAELTVADYIPVYAIVDSLTALKTVNRVQITIGGTADVPFHSISLSEPLDRNESYILPLAVLLSVPFGLVGSFLFVNIFGKIGSISILSMIIGSMSNDIYMQIALIMLIGLLAKNAILIVEFALDRRKQGMGIGWAAVLGASARLRPILMTSLAMIVGLFPLMIATGAGAHGYRTLGTTAIGGMLIGMIFQILIVPVLFTIFEYFQEKVKPLTWDDSEARERNAEIEQYAH